MRKHYLSTIALLIMVALAAGSFDTGNDNVSTRTTSGDGSASNGGSIASRNSSQHGSFVFNEKEDYSDFRIPQAKEYMIERPRFFELREWNSSDGKFKTKAKFVKHDDGLYYLAKESGGEVKLKFAQFSTEDQDFLREFHKHNNGVNELLKMHGDEDLESFISTHKASLKEDDRDRQLEAYYALAEEERLRNLHVTRSGYLAIEMGMNYEQVVKIIGQPNEQLSEVEIVNINTQMLMWEQPRTFGGNCNITFQNGTVVSKAQFGLKD